MILDSCLVGDGDETGEVEAELVLLDGFLRKYSFARGANAFEGLALGVSGVVKGVGIPDEDK